MDVTLNLKCKWKIENNENYVFSENPKLLINLNTGKVINQITNGGSIGYIINNKFISINKLKTMLIKIK
jgi:hypothetical protein